MPRLWKPKAYITPAGNRAVKDWYDAIPADAQAEFDTVLEYLCQRPRPQWTVPEFKMLSGKQAGIGEIRFDALKVEYRPFLIFGRGPGEFTLLIGTSKKGRTYTPKDALKTVVRRKAEIEKDRDGERVHDWFDDDE